MAFTVRDVGSLPGFSGYALAVYPVALLPDTLKPTDAGAIVVFAGAAAEVLATDGDFNVGITDRPSMERPADNCYPDVRTHASKGYLMAQSSATLKASCSVRISPPQLSANSCVVVRTAVPYRGDAVPAGRSPFDA